MENAKLLWGTNPSSDRDEDALYPQAQAQARLRMCCRHTNISRHYVHACNTLHLYFKMYSLPLDSDPPQTKRYSRELCPVSSSWVSHLDYGVTALLGYPLASWLCSFFSAYLNLWRWTADGPGRSWDRAFIIQVAASAVVSLCFFFCIQMSFLSHGNTKRLRKYIFATDHQYLFRT